MKHRLTMVLLLHLICLVHFGQTDTEKLKVGDQAPPLTIQEWIKGEPVPKFEKDQLYVVEFTGTWCPPCIKAIPHLTELSEKYAGKMKLISVYMEINDKNKPDDVSYIKKVRVLAEAMGKKMNFIVAVDMPQQTTKEAWRLDGAGYTYIIDGTGKIVWAGFPLGLAPALEQVIAGTYNAANTLKQQAEFTQCLENIWKNREAGNCQAALKSIDSLILSDPEWKIRLYYTKFDILAGCNDQQAYQWLQWLLDTKVEGFDWPHFIGGSLKKITRENRDFAMELKAIDRTIEESETTLHKTHPILVKARTYIEMGDSTMALSMFRSAIECSRAPGGNEKHTKEILRELIIYQYKLKAASSLKPANKWLRTTIIKDQIPIKNDIIAAVLETSKPDYDFVLWMADDGLNITHENWERAQYLDKKSIAWEGKGNLQKAIRHCQEAIDIRKSIKYYTEPGEKRVAKLTQKQQENNARKGKNEKRPETMNIYEMIAYKEPGIEVRGESLYIRGANKKLGEGGATPLIILNGSPIDIGNLRYLSPLDVDTVEILKGPDTALYGSRGANGVISIQTKKTN